MGVIPVTFLPLVPPSSPLVLYDHRRLSHQGWGQTCWWTLKEDRRQWLHNTFFSSHSSATLCHSWSSSSSACAAAFALLSCSSRKQHIVCSESSLLAFAGPPFSHFRLFFPFASSTSSLEMFGTSFAQRPQQLRPASISPASSLPSGSSCALITTLLDLGLSTVRVRATRHLSPLLSWRT